MVNSDCCVHPAETAVTRITELIGVAPVLLVVKAGIFPLPLAAVNPMAVLLAVQLMVVPGVVLVNVKGPALAPVQNAAEAGIVSCGISDMRNCRVCVVVPHSFVTSSVMVLVPAPVNITSPGSAVVAVAGKPPWKVHL